MSEIRSAMSSIPEENWERAFGKKERLVAEEIHKMVEDGKLVPIDITKVGVVWRGDAESK